MILLTEEEIKEAGRVYHRDGRWTERWGLSRDRAVAKAQAKKIFDALNWQNCDEDFNGVACVDVNVLEELRKELEC